MILTGTLINTLTVFLGASLGAIIKNRLPKRICDGILKGLSLCIIYVGLDSVFSGENPLIAILSITLGAFIGELIDIDKHISKLEAHIQQKSKAESKFFEGFISASLMICVGAWAITGAMDAGIRNDHSSFYAKAIVDCVSTFVLATTMGFGVAFSAISILLYQGGLALLSTVIEPYLSQSLINELTCVGSLLIIAIGLNMMGVTKFKITNLLPALLMPFILCIFI